MANYQPGRMAEKSMFYGASEAPRIHGVHTNGKYDRAPRFKNQYFVAFKFNEVHTTFNAEEMRHITYRVKSFDAPKFQIDTEELNQYNKRRIIPTKIQFQPIQVVFHDDRSNMVQDFWKKIYNFYFQDGVDKAPRKGAPSYGITVPDKVIESAGFGGATTTLGYDGFGYDISGKVETKNLFSYMSLYLVANNDFTRGLFTLRSF